MKTSVAPVFTLLAALSVAACDNDPAPSAVCKPRLVSLAPTQKTAHTANVGEFVSFFAEDAGCAEGEQYNVRWKLGDKVVSYANDYLFVACSTDIPDGQQEAVFDVMAEAVTYTTTEDSTQEVVVASHAWKLTVRDIARPDRPSCYEKSISDVQNLTSADTEEGQQQLKDAATCLDTYLADYACDFEAAYATALAKSALFGESLFPRYMDRLNFSQEDVQAIVEDEIEPIRRNFLVITEKAPDDFAFFVQGLFEVFVMKDAPDLEGDDTIRMYANGSHDKGEARMILTMLNALDGFLSIMLANEGAIEFGLHTPPGENSTTIQNRLITNLEADPEFFTFADAVDDAGAEVADAEGKRLMKLAQNHFIQAIENAVLVFDRVRSETHDQANDLIRYWDCGLDAVCPARCSYMPQGQYINPSLKGDTAEYNETFFQSCEEAGGSYEDRNLNGKCDEKWTRADLGECNQAFDDGEIIGTTRIAWGQSAPKRQAPQTDVKVIQKVLRILQDNLRGPDALPLDKIGEEAGLAPRFISSGMLALGIPYPEVRLSEFFVTPNSFRQLVPLYSKAEKMFILSLENEPFDDFGYDWLADKDEPHYGKATNPDNPSDTTWNPLDPAFDNLDPFCNPICNENDGRDNDGDGLVDWNDRKYGITKDLGVEGNFVFDFIDAQPHNGVHDPGEKSEWFKDVGTVNASGRTIGAGDKKWNKADRAHQWPTGADVGPVSDLAREDDPPNGALTELPDGLYDPYYFMFQDPTFSGLVHFIVDPNRPTVDLTNSNGVSLPNNARLHRFESKVLDTLFEFEFREANAHPCAYANSTLCNRWE